MAELILLIQDSEIQSSNNKVIRAPESCKQSLLGFKCVKPVQDSSRFCR